MNKTTIKKKHRTHKNNIQYRKLRRWVLPAVLGAALSTLAIIPTFAAETQANTNGAVVTTTEQAPTVPSAQGSTPPNGAPHGKPPAGQPPGGAHSATLATDRGEGTITAEAAKLTTSGAGSPVIYSTGNITANNVNGVANNSESGVVEGKNSITLTNSNVTGYKDNGFMLYQSFSGDAESGIARLKAENNTLTTHGTGAFIYVNNTTAEADLTGNTILMPNTTTLVKAAADSRWGKDGENGGHLTLRASNQELSGNIVADSISTVALDMTNGSSLVGTVNTNNSAKEVTLKLSKDSSWTLTGDSYVKSLTNEDITGENIHLNGYKLVVADK